MNVFIFIFASPNFLNTTFKNEFCDHVNKEEKIWWCRNTKESPKNGAHW